MDLRRLSTHYDYLSLSVWDLALADGLRQWTNTTQAVLAPSGNRVRRVPGHPHLADRPPQGRGRPAL
ncbi:MAG: hypothetical protein FJY95_14320 [Candidatus Handelsmanbacteria bacterium]|nr:hypothetical protein [Candidatus Handelsmanbacteria bacterium]